MRCSVPGWWNTPFSWKTPEMSTPREAMSARVASMSETARTGGKLIRRQPILLLIVGISFFLGVSDEGFDRLWEAHFLLDVGVPGFGGLDDVVWFGVLGAGSILLAILVAQPLARRFAEMAPQRMARSLLAFDALPPAIGRADG